MGSGFYEQMRVRVSISFYEALFRQIVESWIDVLTRQNGKISASDASHVVRELEGRAAIAPTHIRRALASRGATAHLLPPGAMKALEDGARQMMNGLVAKHQRELQTRLYNQDHPHPREVPPAPNRMAKSPLTERRPVVLFQPMESSGQWRLESRIALAALFVTVLGVVGTWLAVPGFRDFLRFSSPPSEGRTTDGPDSKSKTTQPEAKAKSEPTTQSTTATAPSPITPSQDEQQASHNSSGPVLSKQVGDFLLAMKECTSAGDPAAQELAMRCVGSIENKGEFKTRLEVASGTRVIDDNGTEYPLWTTGPWGGVVANFRFGAGCCAEELVSGIPVAFSFGLDHMKRGATSINLVLDFVSAGNPPRGEVVFRGVPIRGH